MRALGCLLIFVAAVAANSITDPGKTALTRAYEDSKQKLVNALKDAHPSVLVRPRKELKELEVAGKANLDYITVFGTNVKDQLDASVSFWEQKMAEVIKPYVSSPEQYKNLIIDFFPVPSDPDWNASPQYKDTERQISALVEIAMDQMNKTFEEKVRETRATVVKDATASAWAKYQLVAALRDVEKSMQHNTQYAKRDAANGKYAESLEKIKKAIRDRKSYFDKSIGNIDKEYHDATDN